MGRERNTSERRALRSTPQAVANHPQHHSVLREEVVRWLQPGPGRRMVDGTLGWGGHTEAMLEAGATVWGADRDPDALEASRQRLTPQVASGRLRLLHVCASGLAERLKTEAEPGQTPDGFDGVLLDLGVSSPQIDRPERGFSFRSDGPLDMRMDPTRGETAAELIARLSDEELADVLWQYAEERHSRRIARAIKAALPQRTADLAACVASVLPPDRGQHPATRTFQALRIAVNRELEELDEALRTLPEILASGGRLAIISFHSLEDRRVKECFRRLSGEGAPVDPMGRPLTPPRFSQPLRKAVKGEDLDPHPRARSARLRVLERLPPPSPRER